VARAIALTLAAILALGIGLPAAARADGDPASDVLLSQRLFLPSDAGATAAQGARLGALLASAERAGLPIRVAVVASAYDLGSVTALWRRPRVYAEFLGIELSLVHRQPLIVVMPDGLGLSWPGHPDAAAARLLSAIAVGPGAGGLLRAAAAAVQALAGADGVRIATPPVPVHPSGAEPAAVPIAVLAAAVLALLTAALLALRRRPAATVRAVIGAVSIAVIAAVGVLALTRPWQSAPGDATAHVPAGTPFTWRAGARAAPGFRLVDQTGRPVSPAAFRGRPLIVTFVDPLCRNLCPLAAHVLNQVDSQLPAARRPAIIAVSVDTWADSRADLLQDFHRWSLVPQWHWAIGSPAQLAAVWRRYQITVTVKTRRIAGTVVHFIYHDEAAYVIDGSGYERALYFWPYYPETLEHLILRTS
jgi:cytochrome oxidase Cu insertion factor (SCO1/SenC/PrrC family)